MNAAPRAAWYPDPSGQPGLLRWWDGVGWSAAVRQEGVAARTAPPGGYDAYAARPVPPAAGSLAGQPGQAGQSEQPGQPEQAGQQGGVGRVPPPLSPQIRGRMTFAGVIAGVILVCAIAVSAAGAGGSVQAGVGPGTTGEANPYPTPSYSTAPVTQTLSDPSIGLAVPFPDGWQPDGGQAGAGGDPRYPRLVSNTYPCPRQPAGCVHGVAEIGNATGTSPRAAALDMAAPLNGEAAHGQPDQARLDVDRATTVQGHPAYLLGWTVTSRAADTPSALTRIIMVDTEQADPVRPGRTVYSFLYVALDQVPGAPSAALFDQLRAAIQVHPPVVAPSPSA